MASPAPSPSSFAFAAPSLPIHPSSLAPARRRRSPCPVVGLQVVWAATIFFAEWFHFHAAISACHWPKLHRYPDSLHPSFHVLIIADPQLPSLFYSYPLRSYPLQLLSIHIIFQFIRKAWKILIQSSQPHAVIFLGDLLDAGAATLDTLHFHESLDKFRKTFRVPQSVDQKLKSTQLSSLNLIHLAGNHDVGLFPDTSLANSTYLRNRFTNSWSPGKLNGAVEWGNHSVIWIDAMKLIEEAKLKSIGQPLETDGEVSKFIKGLSGPNMLLPKVLFTHVPLWRPERDSCGPLRESRRNIRQGTGKNYQNEIPQDVSKLILETIQPTIVFSGDDHDYCEVIHQLPSTSLANPSPLSIPEVSVKSFSMGMGVHKPGYHLLTLSNPARFARLPDEKTLSHRPCFLPDQVWLYTHIYAPLYVLTLAIIFGPPLFRLIRKAAMATRQQAKTNGLPIHHRPVHRHRKSLSRTLMFHKASNSNLSSGSSSTEEEGKSDDDGQLKARYLSQRTKRSLSLGIGMANGMDERKQISGGSLESVYPPDRSGGFSSFSRNHEGSDYPPTTPRRFSGSRPSKNDGAAFRWMCRIFGQRTADNVKRYLVRRGLWRRNHGSKISRFGFGGALLDLWKVTQVIILVYVLIWFWFI